MYKRDYIEKIIEQLQNGLAILLSVVKKDDLEQAQEVFILETESFLKMPYTLFMSDKSEYWFTDMQEKYGDKFEIYDAFAALLLQGAELAFESNRITEGFILTTKSQRLYNYLIEHDNSYSLMRENNIERLAIMISKFSN